MIPIIIVERIRLPAAICSLRDLSDGHLPLQSSSASSCEHIDFMRQASGAKAVVDIHHRNARHT